MDQIELLAGRDRDRRGCIYLPNLQEDHVGNRCRGVLVAVHGLGDHGGHFLGLAKAAVSRGWAVATIDLAGHGKSPGRRGHVDSYDGFLADIASFRMEVQSKLPGIPQVLVGHSMGGNLVVNYVLRRDEFEGHGLYEQELAAPIGTCLLAPMLLPPRPMTRTQIHAAWLTGYLVPWFSVERKTDPSKLTDDPIQHAQIETDSLRHHRLSIYLATQLISQGRNAIDRARELDVESLVLVGDQDELIDVDAVWHMVLRAGPIAKLVRFRDARHDLLHGSFSIEIENRLLCWAEERIQDHPQDRIARCAQPNRSFIQSTIRCDA